MRLVEVRLLDGPNVYRLEPAVKVEVSVGRRRSWYGQRRPQRHAVVRLGARVPRGKAPRPIVHIADWIRRLHVLALGQRRIDVGVHRTSEPGSWIVAFPWQAAGPAEAIAHAAYRLTDRGEDPRTFRPPRRLLTRIRTASAQPPALISDAGRRVTLVSVSGTNGKSTTTRMIAHVLRATGRTVAMTTTDGVYLDGRLVEAGDLTGPQGARTALSQPGVEAAVLETARGGILLRGLGYQSNEVSVLTNVSADHLDLQGLHTLPELAEVKSVVAQVTRPNGTVVLNADDPLVAALARRVRAKVCYFSLRQPTASGRLGRHLARGGRAVLLDDGWLVQAVGERRRRIVRAEEIPATFDGLARHNVANALAAAGAALALGITRRQVAAGLRDFRPTAKQMPGRLNLYRLDSRLVVIDYAHNEAGLSALFDLVEALVGKRGRRRATVSAILGGAGDRPDDVLAAIGRVAGQRADEVSIKVSARYLRGRSPAGLVGGFLAGLREAGVKAADVPVQHSETAALRAALTTEGRLAAKIDGTPRVVVAMVHEDRDALERLLREMGGRPVLTVDEIADLRK